MHASAARAGGRNSPELNRMSILDQLTVDSTTPTQPAPPASWVSPEAPGSGSAVAPELAAKKGKPPPARPAVEIRDLNLYYGKQPALCGINLTIPEKQVTAFIGP